MVMQMTRLSVRTHSRKGQYRDRKGAASVRERRSLTVAVLIRTLPYAQLQFDL